MVDTMVVDLNRIIYVPSYCSTDMLYHIHCALKKMGFIAMRREYYIEYAVFDNNGERYQWVDITFSKNHVQVVFNGWKPHLADTKTTIIEYFNGFSSAHILNPNVCYTDTKNNIHLGAAQSETPNMIWNELANLKANIDIYNEVHKGSMKTL